MIEMDLTAYDVLKYHEHNGLPIDAMREIVGARSFSHHMFIAEVLKYNIEKYANRVSGSPIVILELKLKYAMVGNAASFIDEFVNKLSGKISPACQSSGNYLWLLKKSDAPGYQMDGVIITFICGEVLSAAAEIADLAGAILKPLREVFDWGLAFPCMAGELQLPWAMQYLGNGLSPWILDCGYWAKQPEPEV